MNDEILYRYLRGRATPEEAAAIGGWIEASDSNRRLLDDLGAVLSALPAAAGPSVGSIPDAGRLMREAEARRGAAASAAGPTRQAARGRRGRRLLIAAAVVAAFALGSLHGVLADREPAPTGVVEAFMTGRSERATVRLVDGTVVRLAPRTRVEILDWSEGARRLSLDGRAYFAVAPDAERPFRVSTRAGEVRVLGTRFEVNTQEAAMRLVVVEGRVSLKPPRGGDVYVERDEVGHVVGGTASVTRRPDAGQLVDWVGRFLVFQDTPLRDALTEVEKVYGVRTDLSDPDLAHQTVTGLFIDRSLEDVLETLSLVLDTRWAIEDGVARLDPYSPR